MIRARLYRVARSRTVYFLCTVDVPTLADAVRAASAYRARFTDGDRLKVKVIG